MNLERYFSVPLFREGLRRLFERDVPAQEDNQKAIENK